MPSIINLREVKHPDVFSFHQGSTEYVKEISAINQSLRLLLTTSPGELFGDPEFGCKLKEFQFDYIDPTLETLVRDEIIRVVSRYIKTIQVTPEDIKFSSEGTTVYIDLTYRVMYTQYSENYRHVISDGTGGK